MISPFRKMLLIRKFEQKVNDLFKKGLIGGTTHLSVGQEACAAGAVDALQPEDPVVSTHRGHGHLLAKGADPGKVMAELYGKADGLSGGIGGSQHMADVSISFMGSNGITGGGLPVSTGIALAEKMKKSGLITLCFLGDGAVNQGTFHESLNFASVKNLPIVFFCENNQYAMSTSFGSTSPVPHVSDRAAAYSIEGVTIDGNDYYAVKETVGQYAESARKGKPVLIEGLTYRHLGHSKSDKREYRNNEEETEWQKKDPIERCRSYLLKQGVTEQELTAVEEEVRTVVEEAVRFAENSPFPE